MSIAKQEWIKIDMATKNQSKVEVYTALNVDQILPIEVIKRRRELEIANSLRTKLDFFI